MSDGWSAKVRGLVDEVRRLVGPDAQIQRGPSGRIICEVVAVRKEGGGICLRLSEEFLDDLSDEQKVASVRYALEQHAFPESGWLWLDFWEDGQVTIGEPPRPGK